MSSLMFCLSILDSQYLVENMSLTNPTLLNGNSILYAASLEDGDKIHIGDIEFSFGYGK